MQTNIDTVSSNTDDCPPPAVAPMYHFDWSFSFRVADELASALYEMDEEEPYALYLGVWKTGSGCIWVTATYPTKDPHVVTEIHHLFVIVDGSLKCLSYAL